MEAIELLKRLRQTYLYDTDIEGQPKANIFEIMELWEQVNECIET